MLKGTWFLFVLLVVILASSMIFGSWGALEGYQNSEMSQPGSNSKCKGASCSK